MLLTAVDPAEVTVDGTLGRLDKTMALDSLIGRLVDVLDATSEPAA